MKAADIKSVACVGAGVIGSSWATGFALKGCSVYVYDSVPSVIELAQKRISDNLDSLVANEAITQTEAADIHGRLHFVSTLKEAVENVQFVQESILEQYKEKQELLAEIEEYVAEDAIFASSSSALLISEIAKYAKHPERCIGAHPYNPPHLIPLVEITRIENVSEAAAETAKEFYQSVGKEPIVLKRECLGYISNRLQQSIYREMMDLVNRGICSIEDVDRALTFGPGIRWGIMGQNLVWQLGGGEGGIEGLFGWAETSMNLVYKDLACYDHMDKTWPQKAQAGVLEEMAHRPAEIGNDNASIAKWRDHMLISLLKLHKKL